MIRYGIYLHEIFYAHKPWYTHPENPSRLDKIVKALRRYGFLRDDLILRPNSKYLDIKYAYEIHSKEYVNYIKNICRLDRYMIDGDTYVVSKTFDAALTVLASIADAVDKVVHKSIDLAIILGRPPGHHAGFNGTAMGAPTLGFCIFNGSALASKLLSKYGYVLHIDFDLHHGNGTQDILYRNPHVVHIDIHQDPRTIYPGTGFPWDCGEEDALGTKVNILMPPGSGDDAYDIVIDWIFKYIDATNFRPKYLVYSAGFDAYDGDGLGFIKISSSTYHKLAYKLVNELDIDGVIVVLEGGYNIGLERGAPAFIAGLLSLDDPVKDDVRECSEAVKSRIRRMLREVEEYVLVRKF